MEKEMRKEPCDTYLWIRIDCIEMGNIKAKKGTFEMEGSSRKGKSKYYRLPSSQ